MEFPVYTRAAVVVKYVGPKHINVDVAGNLIGYQSRCRSHQITVVISDEAILVALNKVNVFLWLNISSQT